MINGGAAGWHPLLGRLAPLQTGLGLQGERKARNRGLKPLPSGFKRLGLETFLEKAFMDTDNSGSLAGPKEMGVRFLVSVPSVQRHLRGAALLHGSAGSRTPVPSLQPQICFDQMETRSSTENHPVTRRIIISLLSMTSSLLLSTDNQRCLVRAGCLDSGSRPAGQWHRLLSTDQKRSELQSAGGLKD